jgi:hypothetical protein
MASRIGQCPLRDLASPVKRPAPRSVEDARSRFMSPGRSSAPCCGRDADRHCAKLQRLACDDLQIAGGKRCALSRTPWSSYEAPEGLSTCTKMSAVRTALLILVGRSHLCRPRQAVRKPPVTKSSGRPRIGEKPTTGAEGMRSCAPLAERLRERSRPLLSLYSITFPVRLGQVRASVCCSATYSCLKMIRYPSTPPALTTSGERPTVTPAAEAAV